MCSSFMFGIRWARSGSMWRNAGECPWQLAQARASSTSTRSGPRRTRRLSPVLSFDLAFFWGFPSKPKQNSSLTSFPGHPPEVWTPLAQAPQLGLRFRAQGPRHPGAGPVHRCSADGSGGSSQKFASFCWLQAESRIALVAFFKGVFSFRGGANWGGH